MPRRRDFGGHKRRPPLVHPLFIPLNQNRATGERGPFLLEQRSFLRVNRSLREENRSLHGENRSLRGENRSLRGENRSLDGGKRSLDGGKRSLRGENRSFFGDVRGFLDEKNAGPKRSGPAFIECGRHYAVKSRTDGLVNPACWLADLPFSSRRAGAAAREASPLLRVSPQISPPKPSATAAVVSFG